MLITAATTEPVIIIEQQQQICSITLNKPQQHNAFDDKLIAVLSEHLTNINNNANIRVVLLSANGNNFSAGADLNWMKRMAQYSTHENYTDALQLAKMLHQLSQLTKPTIALVHGASYGGGIGLIACCDIAIATTAATFCLSEVKLGLIPAIISPYLIAAMGARQVRRYAITAEPFDAATALQLNLIHEICDADLIARGMQLAHLICRNGPNAVSTTKQLINDMAQPHIDAALLQDTATRIANIRSSAEGQEGLHAFLTKRAANWVPND